ncbi:GYF domain-containing protein [Lysobacter yangpyeongensis]|uniref:GYF domain-containing protein n=1 Tax=Lysobacter yangpyeongensis TaxID=346182 RepID=A0ABW0SNH4_9GAMM
MIDWYYHAPGQGRVGPLSAGELGKHYRERRIQRDTLVWHQSLREWQPLERFAVEIGIQGMAQDAAAPPPMPPVAPVPLSIPPAAPPTTSRGKYTRAPLRPKKTLSTGAIAAIAVIAIVVPGTMILGSVMLSSYRDYARRATSIGKVAGLASGLQQVVADYATRTGRCPDNGDAGVQKVRREINRRFSLDVSFAAIEDGCAFEVAINADGQATDGRKLQYLGRPGADGFAWECRGGDMPDAYRPPECHAGG